MTQKRPWLSSLALVGFNVNWTLAAGRGGDVTFEDVYDGLARGTLFEDLDRKVPKSFDFSLFPPGSAQRLALMEALGEVAGGLKGRERRKVGVESSGLHLLLAFVLEAMQQQMWTSGPGRERMN